MTQQPKRLSEERLSEIHYHVNAGISMKARGVTFEALRDLFNHITILQSDLTAAKEALAVPFVWSEEERDGIFHAFSQARLKHGMYESLFAAAAWLLRNRQARQIKEKHDADSD